MSLHRRAARRDKNEPEIVAALIHAHCLVLRLSGEDLPDLLVGFRQRWTLLEVKLPKGRIKPGQAQLHLTCQHLRLPCYVVHTVAEALAAIGIE